MRGVVMAALHFDFERALELANVAQNHKNLFNEDSKNMTHLSNLLKQFRNLNAPPAVGNVMGGGNYLSGDSTREKIEYIVSLNGDVHKLVKNPYLRLFFLIMIESRKPQRSVAEIFIEFNTNYVINFFDYVTLACKFLNA